MKNGIELKVLLDEIKNWHQTVPDNGQGMIQLFLDELAQNSVAEQHGRFLKNLAYEYERLRIEEYFSERGKALTGRHLAEALLNAASSDAIKSFHSEFSERPFRVKSIEEILTFRDGGSAEMVLLLEGDRQFHLFLQRANVQKGNAAGPAHGRLYPCEEFRWRQFDAVPKGSAEDNLIGVEIDRATAEGKLAEGVYLESLQWFIAGMKAREG